jgi:ABC-2 type transport system permease protein
MTGFLTLLRRDVADNKGALIWTPLIIAAIVLTLGAISLASGRAQFGFNPDDFSSKSSVSRIYQAEDGRVSVRVQTDGRVTIREADGERKRYDGPFTHVSKADVGEVRVTRGADGKVVVTTPQGTSVMQPVDGQFRADIDTEDGAMVIERDQNGKMTITGPDGSREFGGRIDVQDGHAVGVILPLATSVVGALPIGVASIVILFLLAGSLYEERKDRSILFWKSMPVSDLATVGAKLVSIVGVGLAVAFGAAMVMHAVSAAMGVATAASAGVTGLPLGAIAANTVAIWGAALVTLLVHVGWALPVYAWVLLVSAWAPKAPFIAAFVPLGLIPLAARVVNLYHDALLVPLDRLLGGPIIDALQAANLGAKWEARGDVPQVLPAGDIAATAVGTLTQPGFWIGLLVAAALVYAASEVRRRRAF